MENTIHVNFWYGMGAQLLSKPFIAIIIAWVLNILSFISLNNIYEPNLHKILEISQIVSSLIGLIITILTFWFVILKPRITKNKKPKEIK